MGAAPRVDLIRAFEEQALRVGASVHRAEGRLLGTVTQILVEKGCGSAALASVVPERQALAEGLAEAGVGEVGVEALWPTRRVDAGISAARLGIAETGSVLLHSTSEDRRVELCVDVHLVLLPVESLVATLEEAFAVLREISAAAPAYASLVSGPSRSADIERTLTIGVHGPRELHVLLLADGA